MIFGFILGILFIGLLFLSLYLFGANRELRKQVIPVVSENEQLKDVISKFVKEKEETSKKPHIIQFSDEQIEKLASMIVNCIGAMQLAARSVKDSTVH